MSDLLRYYYGFHISVAAVVIGMYLKKHEWMLERRRDVFASNSALRGAARVASAIHILAVLISRSLTVLGLVGIYLYLARTVWLLR